MARLGFAPSAVKVVPEGRPKSAANNFFSIPGVELVAQETLAITADLLHYGPIYVATQITVDRIAIEVTTEGAGGTSARLGIYNADRDWQPTTLVLDAGTVAVDSTGVKTIAINQTLPAGRYLLCLVSDGTPTLRVVLGGNRYAGLSDTLGAGPFTVGLDVAFAFGSLPATGTLWDTPGFSALAFESMVFVRIGTP